MNVKNIFNILGFQLAWWTCVLGVQKGYLYFGPAVMAFYLAVHLFLTGRNRSEINFIIAVGLVGLLVDTAFLQSSFIYYEGLTLSSLAPLWIVAMWLGFSATLNHSLAWLDGKWFYSFLMGAVFGPLSYIAGYKFGAINFKISLISITILSMVWGLVIPILFLLNRKIVIQK